MICLVKKRCVVVFCLAIAAGAVCVMVLVMVLRSSVDASNVFQRYVGNPIPQSVKNIKAQRSWELSGHTYVMHFNIARDDLTSILGSRHFKEVSDIEYRVGGLHWHVDPSHWETLQLYYHGRSPPKWFAPNDWKRPKAYRYKERLADYRGHWQVLIYDEDLGEAYFVEYQEGRW